MKRFHLAGYLLLLILIAAIGFACSSAPNANSATANSESKPEAQPAQQPAPTSAAATPTASTAATTEEVKVFLVAVGDNGKKGKKIGCEDSLVPVTRRIKATDAPLKGAIEELLLVPHEYSKELGNYWWGKNLKVQSVSIVDGAATIKISGEGPFVAGVCDEPRITEQIEETARQFPTVKKVSVFVNDRPLKEVIR